MAFSVYEVVRVACQSRSLFVYSPGVNKPITLTTSFTNITFRFWWVESRVVTTESFISCISTGKS